ncbi:hypothetical protein FRC00_002692 [Tulasnella sp. 408]|nr:hypothetical protein FRC00_002692 [Tulasnella sp. 408]
MPEEDSKVDVSELPQHVLDTRYLKELGERIWPPGETSDEEEEEEEEAVELVGRDLQDVAWGRSCACDPDERRSRRQEGFDEDSDDEDGWFCSFRNIEEEYKMHVVLDQARTDIQADPSDFPKDIREEISERFLLEYDKDAEARLRKQSNRMNPSPPPPTPPPTVFPPFSFQHLPPEILLEIVLLAQASNPHVHITLSHVDASLRAFVNSTPLLWSRVDFFYPMPVVHIYLERSADTLLRVTALPPLHNGLAHHPYLGDFKRDEYNKMMQFFRALRPHRHRIVSLRLCSSDLLFDVSDDNDGQTVAHDFLWDGAMTKLELLDLELVTWMWGGMRPIPSSDSIRGLRLCGPWTKHYMPLFSTRLKSLVMADYVAPFSRILNALKAAPRLTSLTFCDMAFGGTKGKEGSVLNMDHLESLSFIRVFGSAVEALGTCIVAPNLVSFAFQHVNALHHVEDWKELDQVQLFPVPQPSVRRLDLTACEGAPSFFNSVFKTFPCITHLRVASSNLSHEHLLGAIVKPSSQTALPELRHLTIDNEFNELTGTYKLIASSRHSFGRFVLESITLRGIPVHSDVSRNDIEAIEDVVPNFEVDEFDQDMDVYGDSDDSASETSSIGDWASGDDEVLAAFQKYGEPENNPTYNEDPQNENEE